MNKFLKILLGLGCVIGLAIGAVFYFSAGMVQSADGFFAAVQSGDMDSAYSYLSEDFQATTSRDDLAGYLAKNRLDQVSEASWSSRSIDGGRGTLKGSVTTVSGGVVPLTLGFVKGEDGWKIYTIQKPSSGLQQEDQPLQVPAEEELIALVNESVGYFIQSVEEGSMATFYGHVSRLWQQQFPVEKFDEVFASFYGLDADFSVLQTATPVFSAEPAIDDKGVLVVSGYYRAGTLRFQFEQMYIYEGLKWKLVGFSAYV